MTKKELQARCKADGIKGYSRWTVAQLIEALDGIGERFEYADAPTNEQIAAVNSVPPVLAWNIADAIAFAGNSRAQQAYRKEQKALRFEKRTTEPTDPVSRIVTALAFAHPKVRKAYRRALRLPKRLRQQAAELVA